MPNEFRTDIAERLDALHGIIDAALDTLTTPAPGQSGRLLEAIRYSLLAPGKRVRPLFTLLACELGGGDPNEAIAPACAVEMIHAYSLVHDDLPAMDDDDLRRGRPTCHVKFDEATAILAGDALQSLAFRTIAAGVADPAKAVRCTRLLSEAAGPDGMVGGQADDTCPESIDPSLEPAERLLRIHRRKTGALLRVALELGAVAAGASGETFRALGEYGEHFGLAFQITDDLLDCTGDEAEMGKRLRKDAGHDKLTYPGVFGLEKALQDAAEEVKKACKALDGLPRGFAHDALVAYAEYLLKRKN